MSLLALAAVVHGIRHRSLHDYVVFSAYIGAALGATITGFLVHEWRRSGIPKFTKGEVLAACTAPIWLLLWGALVYSFGAATTDAADYLLSATLTPTGKVVVVTTVTLVAGVVLWWFRLRRRILYGLTEAVVGLTVAATRFASQGQSESTDPAFYLALLTAGVYLVVRGLDNIHQGVKERRIEPSRAAAAVSDSSEQIGPAAPAPASNERLRDGVE